MSEGTDQLTAADVSSLTQLARSHSLVHRRSRREEDRHHRHRLSEDTLHNELRQPQNRHQDPQPRSGASFRDAGHPTRSQGNRSSVVEVSALAQCDLTKPEVMKAVPWLNDQERDNARIKPLSEPHVDLSVQRTGRADLGDRHLHPNGQVEVVQTGRTGGAAFALWLSGVGTMNRTLANLASLCTARDWSVDHRTRLVNRRSILLKPLCGQKPSDIHRSLTICAFLLSVTASVSAQTATVTFTHDVAPIIFRHCSGCHRPGQPAPFSLLSYEDIRPRARGIVRALRNRSMPPWKPEPGSGEFEGDRRLDIEQISLIERWVEQGALRGNPADLPLAPAWAPGWQTGEPDLVVTMPEPYELAPNTTDSIRTFVIPIPLHSRRFVRAIEFQPGNFKVVHHANIKIDSTRGSRWLDEEEPGPGYEGGGGRHATFPDGHFLGWTPGQLPRISPAGMAWSIGPGSDLVVELHLNSGSAPELVKITVGLFFTEQEPTRLPYMLRLGNQRIDIPAEDRDYTVVDTFLLPIDVEVLAIQPHAHNLATDVLGYAVLPDGSTRSLIHIRSWDFAWQDVYRYVSPLMLPKGTILTMRYVYDNSSANRNNPFRPPRRVTFGQASRSEMGDLWIQVAPLRSADRPILDWAFTPKMLAEDTAGYLKILDVNSRDPRAHQDLASCYLELGRVEDARTHLEEAVRLEPDSAWAHYDLGIVLLKQRAFAAAEAEFRKATDIKPTFAEAHNNLGTSYHAQGNVARAADAYRQALRLMADNEEAHYNLARALAAQGRNDEAIAEFQLVLRMRPDDAEAHSGLATLFVSSGRVDEAVAHYRGALRIAPDSVTALVDLAWLLATSNRSDVRSPDEAVELAERAAILTSHRNATVLGTLALAYKATLEVERAIATAECAIELAIREGDVEFARQLRLRVRQP
jgi:Flp pilus assembly protein TadD